MTGVDLITRVKRIYDEKSWSSIESPKQPNKLFNRLVDLCSEVDANDLGPIYTLIEEFVVIRDYRHYAEDVMNDLINFASTYKKVIVLPVKDPRDKENSSGNATVYEVMAHRPRQFQRNIVQFDTPFSGDIICEEGDIVVFVDDFIGSGRQFIGMLEQFRCYNKPTALAARSIAIMRTGFEAIKALGVDIKSSHVLPKALTGGVYFAEEEIEAACAAYDRVEAKIRISSNFKRGDSQCEAVISMKRTPNSTLPIFWADSRQGGGSWPAPFPRS